VINLEVQEDHVYYVSDSAILVHNNGCPPKVLSKKSHIKKAQLPTKGKVRYVPPKNWHPSQPLPRGSQNGRLDKFGNEWTKGPSRTQGQPFEWDVQRPDGSHWNISLDGKVTH
jgi:filamentous hemagglutinin